MATEVFTSSPAHPGPLALVDVAALLGRSALPEDTELWVSKDRKHLLGNLVDVGDAGDVGDDEEGLEELVGLLSDALLAEPEPEPEQYTREEAEAIEAVRRALLADGVAADMVGEAMLVVTTMNCKLRVDSAVVKYKEFLGVLEQYGLGTPLDLLTQSFERIDAFFPRFSICGDNKDKEGRSVMWINGGLTREEDESRLVRTSCLMFLACHADLVTLREGITMCIDTSTAPEEKVGNERKLQETWQAYPLRPQHFFISASPCPFLLSRTHHDFIVGASPAKRLFINALLKVAATFSSSKVIQRIRFVEVEEVKEFVDEEKMPAKYGGRPGPDSRRWIQSRLQHFPLPATSGTMPFVGGEGDIGGSE